MLPTRAITTVAAITLAGLAVFAWNHHRRAITPPPSSISEFQPFSISAFSPLSPLVATITRDGPSMPYLKLTYELRKFDDSLTPADISALCAFIEGPKPAAFDDLAWGSIVNDIEEALTVQRVPSDAAADCLARIHRDTAKPMIQRDYAVQHLGGFLIYLVRTTPAGQPLPKLTLRLMDEMRHATADPMLPLAGTALNLLDGICRAAGESGHVVPGLDTAALATLALTMAGRQDVPANVRLPALQIAARHGATGAADLARATLADPAADILRVQGAAAVLARSGTPADLPALEALASQANPHTKPAATEALTAIRSRTKPNP